MQQLRRGSNGRVSPDRCAKELLLGLPTIMRFIRRQMRGHRHAELTIPQFRVLIFLSHSGDSTLSATAEHVGLSLPAASRMVDLLVKRGLTTRRAHASDRRRVSLSLTSRGRAAFKAALAAAEKALARSFRPLSGHELGQVVAAIRILNRALATDDGCPLPAR
jgi:DNA-binding MarR family transcriptional regulator